MLHYHILVLKKNKVNTFVQMVNKHIHKSKKMMHATISSQWTQISLYSCQASCKKNPIIYNEIVYSFIYIDNEFIKLKKTFSLEWKWLDQIIVSLMTVFACTPCRPLIQHICNMQALTCNMTFPLTLILTGK